MDVGINIIYVTLKTAKTTHSKTKIKKKTAAASKKKKKANFSHDFTRCNRVI